MDIFLNSLKMVYYTTVVNCFLVLLLFDGKHALDDNVKMKLKLDHQNEYENNEKNILSSFVSLLSNLKDWHTVKSKGSMTKFTNVNQVSLGSNVFSLDEMKKKIHHSMNNMNCTYAYYAKIHLELIQKIIDDGLFLTEIMELIYKINYKYTETTLKMLATLINMNYEPPDWMEDLIEYLEEKNERTFCRKLQSVLGLVTHVVSTPECEPKNLESVLSIAKVDLKAQYSEDNPWIIFQEQNKKPLGVDNADQWYQELSAAHPYNLLFKIKFYRAQIYFNSFEAIIKDINNNLSDINYLIYLNDLILPYTNYKLLENYGTKKKNRTVPIRLIKVNDKNELLYDNTYKNEITTRKKLQDDMISMNNINVLRPVIDIDIFEEDQLDSKNYMGFHRRIFTNLNRKMNSVMKELQCTYLYYAVQHLTLTQKIIAAESPSISVSNDVVKLISSYFDVSLKTLATIFNKKYQAPEWMVLFLLYLQKVKDTTLNRKTLKAMSLKILRILKRVSCKMVIPPTFFLPQKDLEITVYNPLQILIMQFILINITTSNTGYYKKNVIKAYTNILQVNYLLQVNEHSLSFSNYMEFNSSYWLIDKNKLNSDILESLRWDLNLKKEKKDTSLQSVINTFLKCLVNFKDDETTIITGVQNSIWIHRTIMNLMQTALIRYSLLFLAHCKNIKLLINSVDVLKQNNDVLNEYKTYCSGISVPLKNFIQLVGLEKDLVLNAVIEEIDTEEINETNLQNTIKLGVQKLHQCSINMQINAHVPILPIWNSKILLVHSWPLESEKNILEKIFYWVKDVKQALIGYISIFQQNFNDIDFLKYNLLLKSFGNEMIHPYNLE